MMMISNTHSFQSSLYHLDINASRFYTRRIVLFTVFTLDVRRLLRL